MAARLSAPPNPAHTVRGRAQASKVAAQASNSVVALKAQVAEQADLITLLTTRIEELEAR